MASDKAMELAREIARDLRIKIHDLTANRGKWFSPDEPSNKEWLDRVCAEDAKLIASRLEPIVEAAQRSVLAHDRVNRELFGEGMSPQQHDLAKEAHLCSTKLRTAIRPSREEK
jgi:hypothetical protein